MLKFRDKEYKHIFWDWLWTVYDDDKGELFPWVEPFFKRTAGTKHYMISWAAHPVERKELIENSVLMENLVDYSVDQEYKKDVFKEMIKKYQIPMSEILVVGDSMNNELAAAKELGLDWVHISDFVEESGLSATKKG